jgi:phospho-N-acetylmuramoyl-pentapeptide-transferase
MLYHLFTWLQKEYHLSGAGLFQFITFRAALAIVLSLLIATVYGKRIIAFLQKKQIGESVRELGLSWRNTEERNSNNGRVDHSFGYHLFLRCCLRILHKVYIRLMLLCTVWLGIIGFLDDYFKIKARKTST